MVRRWRFPAWGNTACNKLGRNVKLCGLALCTAFYLSFPEHGLGAEGRVVIGTGSEGGVYLPLGKEFCAQIHRRDKVHDITCEAVSTGGSVDNIERLRRGEVNFAIVQADILYYAMNGFGPFKGKSPMQGLRSVGALHTEIFTVLSRVDSNIRIFNDLKGKRVLRYPVTAADSRVVLPASQLAPGTYPSYVETDQARSAAGKIVVPD